VTDSSEDLEGLVAAALAERDDDRRDERVWRIVDRDPDQRIAVVRELLAGDGVDRQILAADVVAATPDFGGPEGRAAARELGLATAEVEPFDAADRAWLEEALCGRLDSTDDPDLAYSLIAALGEQHITEGAAAIGRRAGDADEDVRFACAVALGQLRGESPPEQAPAVQALLRLARDPIDRVRDWALFGLGQGGGTPVDTPEVRAAFVENATHPDHDVRAESIRALAQLGDVEMLATAISSYELDLDLVEVAARLGDPRLHEPLRELLARESTDPEALGLGIDELVVAIAACAPTRA
jgi:HEAT repeat protein